jgi:hypothetical protein
VSPTAARLIVGLAIILALFWTVALAVSLSIAWFWHVTGEPFSSSSMPRWMLSPGGGGRRRPSSF